MEKSDSTSKPVEFFEIYTELFTPLKDKKIRILEIGIDRGGSLKIWRDYFKKAEVIGLDIEYKEPIEGVKIIQGNQKDTNVLDSLGSLDIVIDDGGHKMSEQKETFKHIFPRMKEGSIYIIEDTETSYWAEFIDEEPTTIDWLKTLIDSQNEEVIRNERRSKQQDRVVEPYKANSITFYTGLCVIKK